MAPHPLVWVQLRRVGRQIEQPQLALFLFHEVLDHAGPVGGVVARDQEERALLVVGDPARAAALLHKLHLNQPPPHPTHNHSSKDLLPRGAAPN